MDLLRGHGVKVWFVNVVDLLKIQNACENDQAISDDRFTEFFGTGEKPALFCFHAYAGTIRRLVWARPGHDAWCVHGYEEKGSTTTPFDMLRLNNMDRWALAAEALRLIDGARGESEHAEQIEAWERSASRRSSSPWRRATTIPRSPIGCGPMPPPTPSRRSMPPNSPPVTTSSRLSRTVIYENGASPVWVMHRLTFARVLSSREV